MANTETRASRTTDAAQSTTRNIEKASEQATDYGLFHLLTLGSIGASIYLFLNGKKLEGIFVGLWAPTFEALRSSFDKK